jgi:hypothetical protein
MVAALIADAATKPQRTGFFSWVQYPSIALHECARLFRVHSFNSFNSFDLFNLLTVGLAFAALKI